MLSRPLFGIQLPGCTNAHSSSSLHPGKCCHGIKWHCYPEWHNFPVYSLHSLPLDSNRRSRWCHLSLTMCTHAHSEFQGKDVFFQLCPRTLNVHEIWKIGGCLENSVLEMKKIRYILRTTGLNFSSILLTKQFASEVLCKIESGPCTFLSDESRFLPNDRIAYSNSTGFRTCRNIHPF